MSNARPATALLLLMTAGCPAEVAYLTTADDSATSQPVPETSSGQAPTDGAATMMQTSSSGDDPVDDPSTSTSVETTGSTGSTGSDSKGSTSWPDSTSSDSTSSDSTSSDSTSSPDSTSSTSAETTGSGTTAAPTTYSVTVILSGLDDDSATLKLDAQEIAAMGDGAYTFPIELMDGAAYQVTFGAAPVHHQCVLYPPGVVVQGMDVIIPAVCVPKELLLAEIGLADTSGDSFWIELAHVGSEPLDLGEYSVRAWSLDPGVALSMETYELPSRVLAPGDRVLLRGALPDVFAGPAIVPISKGPKIRPWFVGYGAVELLKADKSRDYVAFGTIPASKVAALAPTAPDAWANYPADTVALPAKGTTMRGKSIARDLALADSDTRDDWSAVEFSTPGGLNDTHGCILDADADGLPDCSEVMGASYAGVDIYGLGARQGQRDIFLELDYMDPKGKDGVTVDAGIVPYMIALKRVVDAFAARDFHLHVDVGPLFDPAPGLNLANLDRGGGNQVEYAPRICFGIDPACTSIHAIKAQHLAAQRLSMFHYAVFADKSLIDWAGGQGERPGNDLYLSLGSRGYNFADEKNANLTYIIQAVVLMHELGHNLGLSHGGYSAHNGDPLVDEANYKPNYLSVMNYLYNSLGLPVIGPSEGDRYYYRHQGQNVGCKAKGIIYSNMKPPANGPIGELIIDYSSGAGATIDLAAVDETKGLGRVGSQWVDYNCNNTVDPPYSDGLYVAVDNNDQIEIANIRDHDDWGALDLYFLSTFKGFDNGMADAPTSTSPGGLRGPLIRAPVVNDVQPLDAPDPAPLRAAQD